MKINLKSLQNERISASIFFEIEEPPILVFGKFSALKNLQIGVFQKPSFEPATCMK